MTKKVKDIVLIRPNVTNDKKDNYVTFPMGIGYIASVLRDKGYNVYVIDLTLRDVNYDNLLKEIRDIYPQAIGISALSYSYSQVKKLSYLLKRSVSSTLILGGHLAYHNHDIILNKTGIDICVIGEGELTIVDLLKNLHDISVVKGIAYKENNKIILTKPRELIEDLDSIPFPAYELFDIEKYSKMAEDIYLPKKFLIKKKEHRQMAMEIGRGCPFSCRFCSKMFKNIRRKSVNRIVKEIYYLKTKYNIDIFGFKDELLFICKKYINPKNFLN